VIATLLIAALALPPDSSAADSARAPHSISASAADTARSSAADSVVMVLPETRIERERPVDPARRRLPTAFTSVIPVGQSNRALESLSEVLGEAAGVHVDRYGGLGAFSTVSMRGSTPGQVSVYLDGAPLMSAGQSVVNLSDLSAGAIDHVEVYRGLSPLAFGPATPGGAINLVTAPAAATREARVTYGSFDTWEARASAARRTTSPMTASIRARTIASMRPRCSARCAGARVPTSTSRCARTSSTRRRGCPGSARARRRTRASPRCAR